MKFKSGVDKVKDAPHARRPKTATSQIMVGQVIDSDNVSRGTRSEMAAS
jgi:hypothetical protein